MAIWTKVGIGPTTPSSKIKESHLDHPVVSAARGLESQVLMNGRYRIDRSVVICALNMASCLATFSKPTKQADRPWFIEAMNAGFPCHTERIAKRLASDRASDFGECLFP
jgi:hypothetical protein